MKKLLNNGLLPNAVSAVMLVCAGLLYYFTLRLPALILLCVCICLHGAFLAVGSHLELEYLFARYPEKEWRRRKVILSFFAGFILLLGLFSLACVIIMYR